MRPESPCLALVLRRLKQSAWTSGMCTRPAPPTPSGCSSSVCRTISTRRRPKFGEFRFYPDGAGGSGGSWLWTPLSSSKPMLTSYPPRPSAFCKRGPEYLWSSPNTLDAYVVHSIP